MKDMKKIYLILILTLFVGVSVFAQTRIYPPALRAPENNSNEQYPSVILDWDAVTGQTGDITYEVQLATQPDFSDAVTFPRTDLTALEMSELLFGSTYFWHVRAYDGDDASEWSETWTFIVIGSVNITQPTIDESEDVSLLLEWKPIEGLTKYQVQIDTTYEWMPMSDVTDSDVLGTYVLAADNMWMVGESGMIQHYDGSSWMVMDAGVTENLNGIFMHDASTGYIVGDGGIILHYDGTTWTNVDAGITDDLYDIHFVDGNNGWAVGADGAVINFTDGTWTEESTPATGDLKGVFVLSTSNVWACGSKKEILHFDGSEWTVEVVGIRDHNDIWFVDEKQRMGC